MSAIGQYELQGELGRGAMAIVWRAFDTNLEREVAIKEPVMPANADSATAAEFAARFVREGKAAAKLNHPGIVTIYNADIYDGRPAIVMELIEGETLATILSRGALEPQSALAVLDQLLDAAGYAHSKGVVHRDIKPDNVFVTHDGRIKLADFGIAHVGTGATLTQAGTVMGTPGYMAPEQVTGSPVDARADIFAIGAIAYEMLVGHNPFGATDGTAPTTIMYRIVHEPAPALPAAAFAGLPADLSPVIAAALAKDPAERLASAQDFRSALAGGPIVTGAAAGMAAPAPGFSPQATPTVVSAPAAKSNWTPYLLVGAAGIAVIAGLFMFAGGTPGGGATAPPARQDATVGTIEPKTETIEPNTPPEPEPVSAPEPTVDQEAAIADTVESWRTAWESGDLNEYMSYYDSSFYSRYKHKNKSQWRSYKKGLFREYAWQTVAISGMTVKVSGSNATVKFNQRFQSNKFSDYGAKTLKMVERGGRWLITGEEWKKK